MLQKECCGGGVVSLGCQCEPCMEKLKESIDYTFKLCGGIGLFFSFTEVKKALLYCRQSLPDSSLKLFQ